MHTFSARTLILLITGVVLGTDIAEGTPSLDSKYRTSIPVTYQHLGKQIETTIVVAKDPFAETWHYIPPSVRLVTEGDAPKMRFLRWVQNEVEHAVIQFAVVMNVQADVEMQLRKGIVKWYEDKQREQPSMAVPAANGVSLSPVGPLRLANMQMVLFDQGTLEIIAPDFELRRPDEGDNQNQPAEAGADKESRGRMGVLPGVSDLSQETWVQYELSGPAVQIVEALITGEGRGGLLLVYQGQYLAYEPEVSCEVTLNTEAFIKFFREHKEERSGWSFLGLIGDEDHSVYSYVNSKAELKDSLDVKRVGGGNLTPEEMQKIEDRLYAWVTREVFEPMQAVVQTTSAAQAPSANKPNLLNVGPIAAVIFELPALAGANLSLGYASSDAHLVVKAEGSYSRTSRAKWSAYDRTFEDAVLYGAIGLQEYPDGVRRKIVGEALDLEDLPAVVVSLPRASTKSLRDLFGGSFLTVTEPTGDAPVSFKYQPGASDDAPGEWIVLSSNQAKNWRVEGSTLIGTFDRGTDVSRASATWKIPDANAVVNTEAEDVGDGLPDFVVSESADSAGTIRFGSDRLPFKPLVVSINDLLQWPGMASARATGFQPTLTLGATKNGGTEYETPTQALKISCARLSQEDSAPTTMFLPGPIEKMEVMIDGTVTDFFRGDVRLRSLPPSQEWLTDALKRINAGSPAYLFAEPATVGLRRNGIGFNLLPASRRIAVSLSPEGGDRIELVAIRDEETSVLKDAATNQVIPEGVFWFVTQRFPQNLKVDVTIEGGEPNRFTVAEEDVQSWIKRDGGILLLNERE